MTYAFKARRVIRVVYTEGYRDRFTEACLKQLKKKQAQSAHLDNLKEKTYANFNDF